MKEQAIEKNVAAEIKGGRASSRNLSSRLKKLGRHSIKQQEIIYNQVSYVAYNQLLRFEFHLIAAITRLFAL